MSGNHDPSTMGKSLKWGIVINTCFTIFEFIVGFSVGSLALVSDAGHNLTDSLSLVIALFGNKVGAIESDKDHTYGHGRASILTALLNALILFALAFFIFYEAYQRILNPSPVAGKAIIIVAILGIIVNGSIALIFRNNREDLNVRSAFLNMAFDTLASVGALVAGILIIVTGKSIFDPIISIVIGVMLLIGVWGVVRDALHILLEGVPKGLDINNVKEVILNTALVKQVDDMHIWAISSQYAALSCHIVLEDCTLEQSIEVVGRIKKQLKDKFHIEHSTIETELAGCLPK